MKLVIRQARSEHLENLGLRLSKVEVGQGEDQGMNSCLTHLTIVYSFPLTIRFSSGALPHLILIYF